MLNHMRERLADYQEQYGDLYNLEATPAESTAYRLAKHDLKRLPGHSHCCWRTTARLTIPTVPTCQWAIPTMSLTAMDIQDDLQTLYTSGTVFPCLPGRKAAGLEEQRQSWCVRWQKTIVCPITPSPPPIPSAATTGISQASSYTCPDCGATTPRSTAGLQVITVPVQNWNDGKAEEYKHRRLYNIGSSLEKHPELTGRNGFSGGSGGTQNPAAGPQEPQLTVLSEKSQPQERFVLFATKTCPNCKMAEQFLAKAGLPYEKLIADENPDLAEFYGVKQAPTLVAIRGQEYDRIANVSNIKKFTQTIH